MLKATMEGQSVPNVELKLRENNNWKSTMSGELFQGKTVVVFSLPGAFTPTCSSAHVPRYEHLAPSFFENGVDEIFCFSVNDAFVMAEWADSHQVKHVKFIPDGSGSFTEGMGMLVNRDDLGFGKRSWRYAMIVKNGVVEKMFVEPEKLGDPFEVSDADSVLASINPNANKPHDVTIFTRKGCAFCLKASALLKERGMDYEELMLNRDYTDRTLRAVASASTFPQIYINGEHIGGADELERWLG